MSDLIKRLCRPGYDLQKEQAIQEAIIEIRELRAKVEAMERQEPYAFAVNFPESSRVELVHDLDEAYEDMTYEAYEVRKLYLAPGAQPAPMAVAYLDIGANGYMDIGTDLTDEELDTIPKGRHMLGIVGTYGIEGYVPAQPAPSVPEVTDAMAIAFHCALTDVSIGEHEVEEIKKGLRAALAAAPKPEGE